MSTTAWLMPGATGNCRIEWLMPGATVEWLDVIVEVAEPSPQARICYTATWPPRRQAILAAREAG
jgi:hypothetical protein